jgi:hypothetical protein
VDTLQQTPVLKLGQLLLKSLSLQLEELALDAEKVWSMLQVDLAKLVHGLAEFLMNTREPCATFQTAHLSARVLLEELPVDGAHERTVLHWATACCLHPVQGLPLLLLLLLLFRSLHHLLEPVMHAAHQRLMLETIDLLKEWVDALLLKELVMDTLHPWTSLKLVLEHHVLLLECVVELARVNEMTLLRHDASARREPLPLVLVSKELALLLFAQDKALPLSLGIFLEMCKLLCVSGAQLKHFLVVVAAELLSLCAGLDEQMLQHASLSVQLADQNRALRDEGCGVGVAGGAYCCGCSACWGRSTLLERVVAGDGFAVVTGNGAGVIISVGLVVLVVLV